MRHLHGVLDEQQHTHDLGAKQSVSELGSARLPTSAPSSGAYGQGPGRGVLEETERQASRASWMKVWPVQAHDCGSFSPQLCGFGQVT